MTIATPEELQEYEVLLRQWRFHEAGDELFIDGSDEFKKWSERFHELRSKMSQEQIITASKNVGWRHD